MYMVNRCFGSSIHAMQLANQVTYSVNPERFQSEGLEPQGGWTVVVIFRILNWSRDIFFVIYTFHDLEWSVWYGLPCSNSQVNFDNYSDVTCWTVSYDGRYPQMICRNPFGSRVKGFACVSSSLSVSVVFRSFVSSLCCFRVCVCLCNLGCDWPGSCENWRLQRNCASDLQHLGEFRP